MNVSEKNVRCFPNSSADDVYSCLFRKQNKRGEEKFRNRKKLRYSSSQNQGCLLYTAIQI